MTDTITSQQLSQLESGINTALVDIESALRLAIQAQSLPLIGGAVSSAFNAGDALNKIEAFQSAVDNAINTAIGALGDPAQATLSAVQTAINNALTTSGFGSAASVAMDGSDLTLHLGASANASESVSLLSDLGLSGLGLQTSGTATATVSYSFGLTAATDASGSTVYLHSGNALSVNLGISAPSFSADANLGFLNFHATDQGSSINGHFDVALTDSDSNGKVDLSELAATQTQLTGTANANVHLESDLGSAALPSISADLQANWSLGGGDPTLQINNVSYDLGTFFQDYLEPILAKLDPILQPIHQILDAFNADITPLDTYASFLDVAGAVDGNGDDIGDGKVTLLDFIKLASDALNLNIDLGPAEKIAGIVDEIVDAAEFFTGKTFSSQTSFNFGSFTVPFDSGSFANAAATLINGANDIDSFLANLTDPDFTTPDGNGHTAAGELRLLLSDPSFSVPFLSDPAKVIGLLLGEDVDLLKVKLPELSLTFGPGFDENGNPSSSHLPSFFSFPVFPGVNVELQGDLEAKADLGFGYDTRGLQLYKQGGFSNPSLIFDGFYIDDNIVNGVDKPEISIQVLLQASIEASIYLASVGGGGNIGANINLDLNAPGGKLYVDQLVNGFETNPFGLFFVSGEVTAGFNAYASLLGHDIWDYDSPRVVLYSFDDQEDASGNGPPPDPNLATINGTILQLSIGDHATDRAITDKFDSDETFAVDAAAGGIDVNAFGRTTHVDSAGLTQIVGNGGNGSDQIVIDPTITIDATLTGGAGIDTLEGGAGNDTLSGGDERDYLRGHDGSDTLQGEGGDDFLEGGAGADAIDGGDGIDTLSYRNSTGSLTIDLSTPSNNSGDAAGDTFANIEIIEGSNSTVGEGANAYSGDTIIGTNNNDLIFGLAGDDLIAGNGGNDTLDGGAGADQILGGTGFDTASYFQATSGVSVTLVLDTGTGAVNGTGTSGEAAGDQLFSIESLEGSGYADTFTGGDESDQFLGLAGADHLHGGGGNDILDGGAGGDELDGGEDIDTASYINATAAVALNLATGGTGGEAAGDIYLSIETIEGSNVASGDDITGDDSTNTLYGRGGDDRLHGTGGVDTIYGDDGDDQLYGDDGNDILIGGAGADAFDGGANTDTVSYATTAGTVTIDRGNNIGHGGDAEGDTYTSIEIIEGTNTAGPGDTLIGDDNGNIFYGLGGDDNINGGAGDDVLEGGAGDDTLTGGGGIDTASYAGDPAGVIVNLGAGPVTVGAVTVQSGQAADGYGGTDTLSGIHAVTGSAHDDTLYAAVAGSALSSMDGDDRILGDAGVDSLSGGRGADTIDGGASGDTIHGNDGNDVITAGQGNDTVFGDDAQDQLSGGDNDDTLDGGAGADTIDGQAGNDTVSYALDGATVTVNLDTVAHNGVAGGHALDGGGATDTLTSIENATGSSGDDSLFGDGSVNTLIGGVGADSLDGRGGADVLIGESGNDTYYVDNAADDVWDNGHGTGSGLDTVIASVNYSLNDATNDPAHHRADIENLTLVGSALSGTGNALDNQITGNGGNNILDGGAGADTLTGGTGDDTYIIDTPDGFVIGHIGDRVVEGADAGIDTLQVRTANFDTLDDSIDLTVSWLVNVENVTLLDHNEHDPLNNNYGLDITGNALNNVIKDNAGNNTIDAGLGDDTVWISGGFDQVSGNTGIDTLVLNYATSTDDIDTFTTGGNKAAGYTGVVSGTGSESANYNGFERLDVRTGSGSDQITTGDNADTISTGGGDDLISSGKVTGAGDADTIDGGTGIDGWRADLSAVTSAIALDLVHNTYSGPGSVTNIEYIFTELDTGSGNDTIVTTALNKNESIETNGGNDTVTVAGGLDSVDLGSGNDTLVIDYSAATAVVTFNIFAKFTDGYDGVTGDSGHGHQVSFSGTDSFNIKTGSGNDTIRTGDNADRIDGGAGNDTLTGGFGDDTFVFKAGYKADTITDFASGSDKLDLSSFTNLHTLEDVQALMTGSVIDFGNGDTLTLNGITVFDLAEGDLILAPGGGPRNHAPTAINSAASANEDTTRTFATSNFLFTDASDSPSNALQSVIITSLTAHGALKFNGAAITAAHASAGFVVATADIAAGRLTYAPAANFKGTDSFGFKVRDNGGTANGGHDTSTNTATMSLSVASVNDAPTAVNSSLVFNEDTSHAFKAADFHFTDAGDSPANGLGSIIVTSLAAHGALTFGGHAISAAQASAGFAVTAADLAAGKLIYLPTANYKGTDAFHFKVRDNGGTANGGHDTSAAAATMSMTLASVNDAPVAAASSITLNEDTARALKAADVHFTDASDSPANGLLSVIVASLPGHGLLKFNGHAVTAAQASAGLAVTAADLAAGKLIYTPTANFNGADAFNFKVRDNGGVANGGHDTSAAVKMSIAVAAVNDGPVITSNGAGASASISVAENTLNVTKITATDVDNPSLTFKLGGVDAAKFAINASTHALTFKAAPDFETPTDADHNNKYQVAVAVSDGHLTDTQSLTIAVTNLAGVTITGTSAADTVDVTHTVKGQHLPTNEEDRISGNAGIDKLSGLGGNDTITGGANNDTMTGGAGNDTFVFTAGFGKDTITDFAAGAAVGDVVSISHTLLANFDAVKSHSSVDPLGHLVIKVDANDTITLSTVHHVTDLNINDFFFT